MKKVLNIIIVLLITVMFIPVVAYAETYNLNQNTSRNVATNVTVGSVDAPVYQVDIEWSGLMFNWKYNQSTGLYGWAKPEVCTPITLYEIGAGGDGESQITWYLDDQCQNEMGPSDVFQVGETYYLMKAENSIEIYDYSKGGRVSPSVAWNAVSKYNYTTAEFTYTADRCKLITNDDFTTINGVLGYYGVTFESDGWYFWEDSECAGPQINVTSANYDPNKNYYGDPGIGDEHITYSGGSLPIRAGIALAGTENGGRARSEGVRYELSLDLDVDRTKTITAPTVGDTIGSVTITLSTH